MKWFNYLPLTISNILILTFFLITNTALISHTSASTINYFDLLQKKLIEDNFLSTRIEHLYANSKTHFDAEIVAKYFMHNEAKLNYAQFTNHTSIENAKAYMDFHNTDLIEAERNYGVDKEIITAILLIETRLGKYIGKQQVFNTLSAMAALIGEELRTKVWDCIPANHKLSRKIFEEKADHKSAWAYTELKAFLDYAKQQKTDPLTIKGSYAGAIGIAQFMPTSLISLGKDGDGDGSVNLFEHPDAICSIANYLKHYGWHPGICHKEALKTLRHYNNSAYYANTVIKISNLLRKAK